MNYGYKLFEERGGKLYPLFIQSDKEVPQCEWIQAEIGDTKGRFAPRPGWHIGEIPDAPWLKGYDGTDIGCYKSKRKSGRRVWCLVEYDDSRDYQPEVEASGMKWLPDTVPTGGCYRFKETGGRMWIIAGEMRVIRLLTEKERQNILASMEYDEVKAYSKYKSGFEKKMKKENKNGN